MVSKEICTVLQDEKVNEVDLSGRGLNTIKDLKKLNQLIAARKIPLHSLNLGANNITDKVVEGLFCLNVKQLKLEMNALTKQGAIDLVNNCPEIKLFDFTNNCINDEGAQALQKYAGDKSIVLAKNRLKNETLKEFNRVMNSALVKKEAPIIGDRLAWLSPHRAALQKEKAISSAIKNTKDSSLGTDNLLILEDTLRKAKSINPSELAILLVKHCPEAVRLAHELQEESLASALKTN